MGIASDGGRGKFVSEINVTPMVDVMLVLLIIFMVIAPMLQPRLRVEVPKGQNPDQDLGIDSETSLVLAAPEEGLFFLNREQVQLADLQERLSVALRERSPQDRVVFIKSAKSIKYGTVVCAIDAIRNAGCNSIGLVSEKKTSHE